MAIYTVPANTIPGVSGFNFSDEPASNNSNYLPYTGDGSSGYYIVYKGGYYCTTRLSGSQGESFDSIRASKYPNELKYDTCRRSNGTVSDLDQPYTALRTYTYNGQTVYYFSPTANPNIAPYAEASVFDATTRGLIAWYMVWGGFIGYTVTYDLENCTGDPNNPTIIAPNATVTNFDFTLDDGAAFTQSSVWIDGDGFPSGTPVVFNWNPDTGHLRVGPITSDITVHVHANVDPYGHIDGESDIPGGGSVSIPGLPGLTATSTGIIGLFSPSVSQMRLLADFMWTDFGGSGTTTEDILAEVVQALKRLISNPLSYVMGLNIIPSQGLSIGTDQEIRFGFTRTGVSMPKLTSQYFTVDCGTINFNTLCGDTFLDYAPYSKFSIYLPYIGCKEVDANDFVGHTIGVVYHGDVVTGGVTAYITKDGSVMYQYSGCCALTIPMSADSWGDTIAGAVQIATAMVAGGASSGAAGVAAAAAKGAASVAANPSLLSPQVAHSGAISGGAGCMGVQHPFVIREAVRFHSTAGFQTISGYPSYYYRQLSNVSGYTTVVDVHLKNIPATRQEIDEIERILKEGAIL